MKILNIYVILSVIMISGCGRYYDHNLYYEKKVREKQFYFERDVGDGFYPQSEKDKKRLEILPNKPYFPPYKKDTE